jgi:hypothetical protein
MFANRFRRRSFEEFYEEFVFRGFTSVRNGWLRDADRIVGAFHGAF